MGERPYSNKRQCPRKYLLKKIPDLVSLSGSFIFSIILCPMALTPKLLKILL